MASLMVYKLVLAVAIAAAVLLVLLQMMQINQGNLTQTTEVIKNGSMKALTENMNTLSDQEWQQTWSTS